MADRSLLSKQAAPRATTFWAAACRPGAASIKSPLAGTERLLRGSRAIAFLYLFHLAGDRWACRNQGMPLLVTTTARRSASVSQLLTVVGAVKGGEKGAATNTLYPLTAKC